MSETKLGMFSWAVAGAVGYGMSFCISALVSGCQTMAAVEKDDPYFKYICLAKDRKGGQSTAFIMRDNGTNWCVTAEHCAREGGFRCRNAEGDKPKLRYLDFDLARNADICRFPIETDVPPGAFTLSPVAPKAGDEVVIYGNARGEDTICKITGQIVSVGPERIEVECEWCKGFSGGPVITEQGVVGVVSFFSKAKKDDEWDDNKFTKLRRFAYRLDTARWDTLPYSLYFRAACGKPEDSLDQR